MKTITFFDVSDDLGDRLILRYDNTDVPERHLKVYASDKADRTQAARLSRAQMVKLHAWLGACIGVTPDEPVLWEES